MLIMCLGQEFHTWAVATQNSYCNLKLPPLGTIIMHKQFTGLEYFLPHKLLALLTNGNR